MAVAPEFDLRVRRSEPMSRHTSWHVGGPAEVFFNPRDRMDLAAFLRSLPSAVPIYWVGLGSNLLVRDGGLDGVVISTHGALDRLERMTENCIYVEAGVPCARLAKQCIRWGLGPAEFFAGIPGTMGGALAMNAGAFGGETWHHVVAVETIDRHGREHARPATSFKATYRHVEMPEPDEWFVGAKLVFERKPGAHDAQVRELLAKRKATQPIGEWSGGSTFTNPPNDHAARLIEVSGLKGMRIGDASVSQKHANFIINHGQARAADIEGLIAHVQDTVEKLQGVRLTPEVRIVGKH
ncbi:MAG TPA: UDP-N-acetylmuramate dehydrogenase [Steroidobacteraceae bacterium]